MIVSSSNNRLNPGGGQLGLGPLCTPLPSGLFSLHNWILYFSKGCKGFRSFCWYSLLLFLPRLPQICKDYCVLCKQRCRVNNASGFSVPVTVSGSSDSDYLASSSFGVVYGRMQDDHSLCIKVLWSHKKAYWSLVNPVLLAFRLISAVNFCCFDLPLKKVIKWYLLNPRRPFWSIQFNSV